MYVHCLCTYIFLLHMLCTGDFVCSLRSGLKYEVSDLGILQMKEIPLMKLWVIPIVAYMCSSGSLRVPLAGTLARSVMLCLGCGQPRKHSLETHFIIHSPLSYHCPDFGLLNPWYVAKHHWIVCGGCICCCYLCCMSHDCWGYYHCVTPTKHRMGIENELHLSTEVKTQSTVH